MTTLCPSKLTAKAYRHSLLLLALAVPQVASAAAYMQRFVYGGDFVGANSASCDALAPIFHNVAALGACDSYQNQVQIGAALNRPSARVRNLHTSGIAARFVKLETNSNDIQPDSNLASIFYSYKLASDLHFGAAYFSPYGFDYKFDYGGINIHNRLQTHSLRLALAYKLADNIFIGGASDVYQFKSQQHYSFKPYNDLKIGSLSLGNVDVDASFNARDVGFNFGALFILNNGATRWGFNYQSAVKAKLTGGGSFAGLPTGAVDFVSELPLGLPQIFSAAMQQQLGNWQIGTELAYNDWHALGRDNNHASSDLANSNVISTAAGQMLAGYLQNQSLLRATLALSLNIKYQLNPNYTVGFGYSAEQSPVDASSNNLPYDAQHWLHLGAAYRHKTWSLTGGFAYMRKSARSYSAGSPTLGKIAFDLETNHFIAGFMLGYFF